MIAITSVGGRTLEGSKSVPGASHVPWRTAAMAMAALPENKAPRTKNLPTPTPNLTLLRLGLELTTAANGGEGQAKGTDG